MTETDKYGESDAMPGRWRRVVNALDTHFGGLDSWRHHVFFNPPHEVLGDNAQAAIVRAADRISALTEEARRLRAELDAIPAELRERARDGDLLGQANRFLQIHAEIKRHDEEFFSGATWEGDDSSVNRTLQLVREYFRQRDAIAVLQRQRDELLQLVREYFGQRGTIAVLQRQRDELQKENEALLKTNKDLGEMLPSGVPLERIRVVYHTQRGTQYDCAAQMERRNGRVTVHVHWTPGTMQMPTTKPELTQWGPRPRVEVRVPYQFNRIRPVQPHPDAPCQNLSGEVTYPAWATSYTKRVVGELHDAWMSREVPFNKRLGDAIVAATELLKDYHRTQHEVYESRDAALEQVKDLESKLSVRQAVLKLDREARYEAVQDVAKLRVKLQKVREILDQTEAAA